MTDVDHLEMLKALADHLGPVMISGYENDLYNSVLEGWRKIKKDTLAEAGVKREETLWLNYADAQLSFEADFPEVMP